MIPHGQQTDETVTVHDAMWIQRVTAVERMARGGTKVRFRRRRFIQQGLYVAPRTDLVPGAVTRREWLRFLTKVRLGNTCMCNAGQSHNHWLWVDRLSRWGYGRFLWRGRKYLAHRFAYIALRGVIPNGMEPDHLCHLGHCVQPTCIEVVTPRENKLRSQSPSAVNAHKTHCPQQHPLSGDNLDPYTLSQGGRRCKVCKNAQDRARYAQQGTKGVS